MWKEKTLGDFILRGAYATIAIIVSPFGLLKTSPFSTILNSQF
jgi:hypothetical protein